jgi:hypothetical protein
MMSKQPVASKQTSIVCLVWLIKSMWSHSALCLVCAELFTGNLIVLCEGVSSEGSCGSTDFDNNIKKQRVICLPLAKFFCKQPVFC